MALEKEKLKQLRLVINENLRIQRGGAESITYIDVANVLGDMAARQNHAVFGRRGCGKTLLIHFSAKSLGESIKCVYLNCEDFKKHSFPNVLIEILDALFAELETNLTGWFGRKKKSRDLIGKIRSRLTDLRTKADNQEQEIREQTSAESTHAIGGEASAQTSVGSLTANAKSSAAHKAQIEKTGILHFSVYTLTFIKR